MLKKGQFPTKAYGDNIIIERLKIKSIQEKKALKSNIQLVGGSAAKNLLDLEKNKAQEMAQYENAEEMLMSKWDEHPNQAIVVSVGPGRDIGDGVLIVPQIRVGEHILIRGKAGEPMIINKKLYWVIKDYDIFSTVPAAELIK